MSHYYIIDHTKQCGFSEISEEDFLSLFVNKHARFYANQVYRNRLSMNEVPIVLQEEVQFIVNNKITKLGRYEDNHITDSETSIIDTGGNN